MTTKVLNLYAGIGGNRKLWEDVDVTAVEWDEDIARYYQHEFPDDHVIVADAHEFLKDNHETFDFIWTSPPCQTHSQVSQMSWESDAKHNADRDPKYPDMRLYQEIIFLEKFVDADYAVENVSPYYDTLIDAQDVGRHKFWSNFHIPDFDTSDAPGAWTNPDNEVFEEHLGFDLDGWTFENARKDQILRNCVDPRLGKHVFEAATKERQSTLGAIDV